MAKAMSISVAIWIANTVIYQSVWDYVFRNGFIWLRCAGIIFFSVYGTSLEEILPSDLPTGGALRNEILIA